MPKSKYGEKQKRGLVPAKYPDRMKGAWQHWPNADNANRAYLGRLDILPRPQRGHTFILPHKQFNPESRDVRIS